MSHEPSEESGGFSIHPRKGRRGTRKDVLSNNNSIRRKRMNGVLVLAVYAVIMMAVTVVLSKGGSNPEEFHVGTRKMGAVKSAMSIAATWIWAPALFTSAEKAYINGIPGLFWFLVPNILCLILFIPFAKMIRKRMPDGITLSGFMGKTYKSESVKRVYLLQLSILSVLSTAVQLLAGGKILSGIVGIDFWMVTVILAAIAYSYSQFSGISASVITDAAQMIFLLAACAVFVPWALKMPGGVENMLSGIRGISGEYGSLFDEKGMEVLLAFGLPTAIGLISGPFGDQCFWQRAFSIEQKKIGKAFALGAIMFGVVPLSMGLLGFIAAGSGYVATDNGIVNFELIQHLFPAWATVPFLFMLISGLLSTVDSNLCAAASLTTDLHALRRMDEKAQLRLSKATMLLLLAVGIGIANIPGLSVTHMFLIYGTLRATTLLPTVFTLCKVKLTGQGISTGVSVALLTGLPVFAYATLNNLAILKSVASLYTVLSAGAIAVIVSCMKWRKA